MREIKINPVSLHKNQVPIYQSRARNRILRAGRRFGKSYIVTNEVLKCCLRGGIAWAIYPTIEVSQPTWRTMVQHFEPLENYGIEITQAPRVIRFPGGGEFRIKSAHRGVDRGEGLNLAIIDEFDFIPDIENIYNFVLRAALADKKGRAIWASTPNGKGYLYKLWNEKRSLEDWESWHFTSFDNPFLDPKELEAIKAELPENVWRQEYLAEFLDDGHGWFPAMGPIMISEERSGKEEGKEYRAGLDIGRKEDATVLSISEVGEEGQPHQQRKMIILKNKPIKSQIEIICHWLQKFEVEVLCGDATGIGLPVLEELEAKAIDTEIEFVVYSNKIKMQMFQRLANAYEKKSFLILRNEQSEFEHDMIRPDYNPNTRTLRIEAVPGYHDDIPNALALNLKAIEEVYQKAWF